MDRHQRVPLRAVAPPPCRHLVQHCPAPKSALRLARPPGKLRPGELKGHEHCEALGLVWGEGWVWVTSGPEGCPLPPEIYQCLRKAGRTLVPHSRSYPAHGSRARPRHKGWPQSRASATTGTRFEVHQRERVTPEVDPAERKALRQSFYGLLQRPSGPCSAGMTHHATQCSCAANSPNASASSI